MNIQPVILSGGSGSRLWPLSREYFPKQLLSLNSELTLLQETIKRLDGLADSSLSVAPSLLVCNEEHRFLVAEQLRQAELEHRAILLEPFGRNTAPALTLAALALAESGDDDSVMLVLPADHLIKETAAFHDALRAGQRLAQQDHLVTFGIVPTQAETGYGYIRKGEAITIDGAAPAASVIAAFVEKPDAATAQAYLDSGDYLWNSGMFMMKASTWLAAIGQFEPGMLEVCRQAFGAGEKDRDFFRIDAAAFTTCPADSIDYAVMERVTADRQGTASANAFKAAVVALDAGWSDIGSWSSLWEVSDTDAHGNVASGDVYAIDTSNSLLFADHRLVATVGVKDLIVIETADAVMVADKSQAQQVKKVVERIKADKRTEHQLHRRVHRPWGCYEGVDSGERFQVKRITVNPGAALSLQKHHHRAEHWVVVRGTAEVTKGDETFLISENESTYIPIGVTHRLVNPGTMPLEIIEVQSGSYLGEDDIVRLEDVYNRK